MQSPDAHRLSILVKMFDVTSAKKQAETGSSCNRLIGLPAEHETAEGSYHLALEQEEDQKGVVEYGKINASQKTKTVQEEHAATVAEASALMKLFDADRASFWSKNRKPRRLHDSPARGAERADGRNQQRARRFRGQQRECPFTCFGRKNAMSCIGCPYVMYAGGAETLDCLGLISRTYTKVHISLSHCTHSLRAVTHQVVSAKTRPAMCCTVLATLASP